jgi:hypothetical protein
MKKTLEKIEVLELGTMVEFGDPKQTLISGRISSVTIYPTLITYEVMFWQGAEFKTIVLRECDFSVKKNIIKEKIGFK